MIDLRIAAAAIVLSVLQLCVNAIVVFIASVLRRHVVEAAKRELRLLREAAATEAELERLRGILNSREH